MTKPNLEQDIEEAKGALSPGAERLVGLLQMWHMFQSAKLVAEDFHAKFDNLSYQLRMACTRSLAIDYPKPWSANYSPEINSLRVQLTAKSWHYPFLDQIVQKPEHEELIELRNSAIAHLDKEYEGGGITLKGARIRNAPSNRPQDPETIDEVFLPAVVVIAGARGIWWLSSKSKLRELCLHVTEAKELVEEEIRDSAAAFRQSCLEHMHVLHTLSDLVGTANIALIDGNVDVKSHAEDPKPLSNKAPIQLKIGDQNVEALMTVYEPRPEYPTNTEILGKGYRLDIGEMSDSGNLHFCVTFPRYPYPKEPVQK